MIHNSYIAIAPRNETEAYVCWDLDPHHLQQMPQQQNPILTLYICDITDLPVKDRPHFVVVSPSSTLGPSEGAMAQKSVVSIAPNVQSYTFQSDIHDCYVTIPSLHRDYVAELGYIDPDGQWLMLTQSTPLRMYPDPANL